MDRADLIRNLEMIYEAVGWAKTHHEKSSEANAAEHCNPKVFYSPLVVKLDDAHDKLTRLLNDLQEENENGRVSTLA